MDTHGRTGKGIIEHLAKVADGTGIYAQMTQQVAQYADDALCMAPLQIIIQFGFHPLLHFS